MSRYTMNQKHFISEHILVRAAYWLFAIDILLVSFMMIKLNYFGQSSVVAYASTRSFTPSNPMNDPLTVKRSPFTVSGQTVVMNGDSMQVFEYSDHNAAMNEASLMAKRYGSNSKSLWKKDAHIYVNDAKVVFYLGRNNVVLDFLNRDAGMSLLEKSSQSPLSLSKISMVDN
jgi:hypothetical protein